MTKNSGQGRPKIVLFRCDQKHTSNTGLSLTTAYDKHNTLPPYWQAFLFHKCFSIKQIVTTHGPGAAHSNNSGRYCEFCCAKIAPRT